jgi:asparagine synthase (glutamine-hydrolysing)
MAGIAGIQAGRKKADVENMLGRIAHRGPAGRKVLETDGATIGVVWAGPQKDEADVLTRESAARDAAGAERLAEARIVGDRLILKRDPLGVAPLYYGRTADGRLSFASEVKALKSLARDIHELPPGHSYDGERLEPHFRLEARPPLDSGPEAVAAELRRRLEASVEKRVRSETMGSWLSGGLDSSTLAALARPRLKKLFTFAAGVPGAPDLEFASEVARHIGSDHSEVIVKLEDMLAALPKVIEHLESFDALLVRSSITNYLVAKRASDFVPEVFSGEAGDELFAGYAYLKSLDPSLLAGELIDIIARLHNTAFQRVDRSASAHGTIPHVAFADPDVVDFALQIPTEYKLRQGTEKWILRRAMDGALPERVLNRTKAKFWEGAGVAELLAERADKTITDDDFRRQRALPNGLTLRTKEELLYYRVFEDVLGAFEDLDWMGRTKGAPEL